ncbi:hypothetical protein NliqN6_0856 [Naganishia liquefaciens]|uniref:Potassium transporter n=1 Tax=Naganishia liquefaciens TaxID=104408 RepID=A0A8H3TQH1_9TREE|nr:hypothetical protein NliqN6_0856 [Naganishia liquefaciens]
MSAKNVTMQEGDAESISTTAPPAYSRRAPQLSPVRTIVFAFSCLGVIYSDIGTSPLYVISTIFPPTEGAPSKDDVIGVISAIIWSISLLPLLKYVIFALSFGSTEGEGGPFALFLQIFPRRSHLEDADEDRELTKFDSKDVALSQESRYPDSWISKARWPLLIWTLFATSCTMADGILTPAVSVTSSVGGLAVVAPSVADNVRPISIAFLLVLFLGQRFGTQKLSFLFAPMTLMWLALLLVSGIINIVSYPGVLRAFDPSRAIMFFVRTKNYDALAGVLLSLTGCEAVFANLGQFNASAIRLSFVTVVYPALVLQYCGQGARLIVDGEHVIANPFYLSIPGGENGGLWWVIWIFGVFATLIASQAMITATFSLIQQLMGQKSFPTIRINYTSTLTAGQVYIPAVNWILMAGTIITVGIFGSSFAMTLAYGFAVAVVMFITTTLLAIQVPLIKGLPWVLGLAFFVFFGFLDGLFVGAAVKKVPHGAWFPLAIGSAMCLFMVFWTRCRELEDKFDRENKRNLTRIILHQEPGATTTPASELKDKKIAFAPTERGRSTEPIAIHQLSRLASVVSRSEGLHQDEHGGLYVARPNCEELLKVQRIPTLAIVHKVTEGKGVPHAFSVFLRQVPALPRVVVFLSVRVTAVPHVPLVDRYLVSKVRSVDGFYGVVMRKGYLDQLSPEVDQILERIFEIEVQYSATKLEDRLKAIKEASLTTTHIVPSYNIKSRASANVLVDKMRRVILEELYGRLRVIFPDDSHLLVDSESTLKVGVTAHI